MKIVLLGYMASGKSTIGKLLAEKSGVKFIDLDKYIEEKERLEITDIFKEKGEIYFRKQEHIHLQNLLALKNSFVLSLGGGTPCYSENMKMINASKDTKSFYIRATVNTLFNRLVNEKNTRPLVANLREEDLKEYIAKHLFERNYYYNQAHTAISTDNKSIDQILNEIHSLLT